MLEIDNGISQFGNVVEQVVPANPTKINLVGAIRSKLGVDALNAYITGGIQGLKDWASATSQEAVDVVADLVDFVNKPLNPHYGNNKD